MDLNEFKELLNRDDRFCRYNNIRLDVLRTGYAEAVMELTENTMNGLGIAQGGSIFTLSDLAFAGAGNSYGFRMVGSTPASASSGPASESSSAPKPPKSAAGGAPASTPSKYSTTKAKSSPTALSPASSPKRNSRSENF